jgi:gas vesicle protein
MEAIKRVFKFGMGGALGAAVGAGVAALLAPKRGEEIRQESMAFIEHVKSEGEAAKLAREQEMMNRFRSQVNDPTAFTEQDRYQPPKQA